MADTFSTILANADANIVDSLGETVTITGKGNVVGVFDNAFAEELGMQGTVPTFTYLDADLATVAAGDALVRGADNYTVRVKQPDGTGMITLILSEN